MSIIQIQKVQREGARVLLMLAGVSGGGKTFTAIQVAYGLANEKAGKVGFLDTENGRGKFYADILPEPFLYGELKPPFSPSRYIEAIQAFADAGVEVLVVDSGSHEFEGIGGIQEIAEAGNPRMPNWNKAKAEHKRFMNALLCSPMHVVLCLRAREKAKPEKGADGKVVYQDLGLQPITEKNVVFEATASLMLHDQGKRQEIIKCPADLLPMLGRQSGYIGVEDGKAIRAWVDGAKAVNPKVEAWRNRLEMIVEGGVAALEDAWAKTPDNMKKSLGKDFYKTLESSAKAYDEARKSPSNAPASVAALNERLQSVAPGASLEAPNVSSGHF